MNGFFSRFNKAKTAKRVDRLLQEQGLTFLDVGAAGGIVSRWKQITPKVNYVGFEPDARSAQAISGHQQGFASYSVIPAAVWEHDGKLTINLTRKPQVSSHYLPNLSWLKRFPRPARFEVVEVAEVSASRIDGLDIPGCDFMKLDIQGGELAALRGAENILDKTLGIEAEVEFLEMYQGQPLFGDVCKYLDNQGFEFVDFINLSRWNRKSRRGFGQCLFGDALFLKSPEKLRELVDNSVLDASAIRRYCAILALYRRPDMLEDCKILFSNEIADDPAWEKNLDIVIKQINREFFWIRVLTKKIFSIPMRFLGNELRVRADY